MRIWYNNLLDNSRYVVNVQGNRIRIGRDPQGEIVLESPFVAPEAAILNRRAGRWELVALGMNGCVIGEDEILGGDRRALEGGETFKIFPFTLTIEIQEERGETDEAIRQALDADLATLTQSVHLDLLVRMQGDARWEAAKVSDEYVLTLERHIDEIARIRGAFDPKRAGLVDHAAAHCVRSELLGRLISAAGQTGADAWTGEARWSRMFSSVPDREHELSAVVDGVAASLGLDSQSDVTRQIGAAERDYWPTWTRKTSREIHEEFKRYLALRHLKKEVKDVVFGYGPLEDLLRSPIISEIMVVDRDRIYVEKDGVLENSGRRFLSDEVTLSIIDRIVARVGRRIDKSEPLVDARLSDGSRVNAVIPPLAVSGPCLTIRKFPARKLLIDDLIAKGSLTATAAEFLRAAVLTRRNILISGGTGSGKTTLLNCLSDFIPDKERIVTIEDTAELQLKKEHVVRLEAKPKNIDGRGDYSIRDLVKNALRMRPDRIVIGECRGAEALDMLQAMNTGHDGSLTTIHANSAEDVILRLEVLVQMAAPLPIGSIHRQISSALDLIVQLHRVRDGRRMVTQISEVVGIDPMTAGVVTKDMFLLDESQDGGTLAPTGCLPTFMADLIEGGLIALNSFYLDGAGRS